MNRRSFLQLAFGTAAALALPLPAVLEPHAFNPVSETCVRCGIARWEIELAAGEAYLRQHARTPVGGGISVREWDKHTVADLYDVMRDAQ